MNEQLTKAQFVALVNAYMGAREHERWARDYGTASEYRTAAKAALDAREALVKGAGYEP